jgi:hypothetical protein
MNPNQALLKITFLLCCLFILAAPSEAQSNIRGLPGDAVILERRKLLPSVRADREIVLWMVKPAKNPTNYASDDIYTCPDQSRGSHYSGPTRVSLVDSGTNAVINTLKISEENEDSFDLPYAIRRGYYYRVGSVKKGEVKPTIIWLRDYNGDGKALEFALFDAVACMGLQTTLIGYSTRQDRMIQYPVELKVTEGAKRSSRTSLWADYLFNKKPRRPGYWKYDIDYRGRAVTLDKWEVRYNSAREQFEGTLTVIEGEP